MDTLFDTLQTSAQEQRRAGHVWLRRVDWQTALGVIGGIFMVRVGIGLFTAEPCAVSLTGCMSLSEGMLMSALAIGCFAGGFWLGRKKRYG